MLLPPLYLGSRPGAEEPVPQREALRKVNVGPYVVALVVCRAQLHLQRLEAVSVHDFGPGWTQPTIGAWARQALYR